MLLLGRPSPRGALTVGLLGAIGLWSVIGPGEASARVFVGALALPIAVFLAIQWCRREQLPGLRRAVEVALFVVLGAQIAALLVHQGPSAFAWSVAYSHHTDQAYWEAVGGHVLGNPNNASVVYCTALGWGAAGLVLRGSRSRNLALCLLSLLCIVATGSRGALLAAALTIVLAGMTFMGRRRALTVLAVSGAAAVVFVVVESVFAPLGLFSDGLLASVTDRSETRLAALPYVFKDPFGSGAGTADLTLQAEMYRILGWDSVGATSHDVFLNWGVALGWVGLAILIVALVRAFLRGRVEGGWVGLLPLVAFIGSAESAGIDLLNATNPAWALLFWVVVGLAWRGGVVVGPTDRSDRMAPAAFDSHPDQEVDEADLVLQLSDRTFEGIRGRRDSRREEAR